MGGRQREKTDDIQIILIGDKQGDKGGGGGKHYLALGKKYTPLHSIWLLILQIEISLLHHYCFILSQNELKFMLQLHDIE
jgi:hypothetical protein